VSTSSSLIGWMAGYFIGFFLLLIGGIRLYKDFKEARKNNNVLICSLLEILKVIIQSPLNALIPIIGLIIIVALTSELIRRLFP
jgi:hypothetical protein